ncbi:hypothetical protein [Paenibacillus popilliae]|uniref:hypothetical protein n=1 Tax=Paenibacillus popilliae TaxID=78057 RepID=UPI0021AE92DE|nr:hypothetical protein [Paenibacillus sp. SDF0028]
MKRTKHSTDFKLQLVKEALETENTATVARRYEIATNMLHRGLKNIAMASSVMFKWNKSRSLTPKQ